MDADRELARAKWLLIALAIFVVTAVLSWNELEYSLRGKTVEAQVSEIREVVESRRRSDELMVHVDYGFQDGDAYRRESDRVPVSWPRPTAGGPTRVQYLPGRPLMSRLEGHRNLSPVAFLVVSLGVFAGFLIPLIREARDTPHVKK